jgi:hypothetical protein
LKTCAEACGQGWHGGGRRGRGEGGGRLGAINGSQHRAWKGHRDGCGARGERMGALYCCNRGQGKAGVRRGVRVDGAGAGVGHGSFPRIVPYGSEAEANVDLAPMTGATEAGGMGAHAMMASGAPTPRLAGDGGRGRSMWAADVRAQTPRLAGDGGEGGSALMAGSRREEGPRRDMAEPSRLWTPTLES